MIHKMSILNCEIYFRFVALFISSYYCFFIGNISLQEVLSGTVAKYKRVFYNNNIDIKFSFLYG